jgi:hypothetical protein
MPKITISKVALEKHIEIEISKEQLAEALMSLACEMCGRHADAAIFNWKTDLEARTYLGNEVLVSGNPHVAAMVDTANFLRFNRVLRVNKSG